ncbi:ATP synthase F1 subunit gamma [Phycisphaera mikurensis]|uniref:ATP synthase gamma chain n=1 Tax=Phycisphaera mikurensis (strain NBRC 102666 / KCTC 22515 / FYK2301M01) TaxID=1142394 RepID=I0IHJ7_PHYMF|nr:ATP synthase F1 subunit gamma [Phycisphaera mikurensis]MBB6440979.1 F-type H+-transporting ATPase subunit gamma [Phycisphaera mikurensis]BAM04735.1 ATP synthase subunit gamma [Phycisphaera mikurensis NBRC 102666]
MPANIREIKGRIKAVKNIQRITKTMQLIASARFQAMQKKATQAHAYADRIQAMVGEVARSLGNAEGVNQPLLSAPSPPAGRTLVLVLTSGRGLCGSYNTRVLREAETLFEAGLPASQRETEMVGKKGLAYAKFNDIAVDTFHAQIGESPAYADVAEMAERYIERFEAGAYDAVKVVYMKFITMGNQRPEVLTLLPMQPPEAADAPKGGASEAAADFEFSPDAETLLGSLLPETVKVTLMRCFNDAAVSEQLARMVAMKAATDAATKQGKTLKRQFNRARQTAITTELSEIIGGAAALE